MKSEKQSIRRNRSRRASDHISTPSLPTRTAAEMSTPSREIQTCRCNPRKAQPKHTRKPLPPTERTEAAAGRASQVRATDATPHRAVRRGGLACSASSHNWHHTCPVYDPCVGHHSIPVIHAGNLLEQIADDSNFLTALAKVMQEPDKASGIDRKSVLDVCLPLVASIRHRNAIRSRLLNGSYYPAPVRTVMIPKANGKMRTLGIATVLDRVVQTMILQAVTSNLPASSWNPHSYAYLPQRSIANAIADVNHIIGDGYKSAITLDLRAFFDNVPHDRLLRKLSMHIKDKRVVKLVTAFITPVMVDGKSSWRRNRTGTPQGSVISPWLASMLYLDELDQELTRRGHRFVRYADDVTIFCKSHHAAKRIKNRIINFIEGTMKCPVNHDKTKVVDVEHLSILGVTRKHGKWFIDRDKVEQACGAFLSELYHSDSPDDDSHVIRAATSMYGFLNHYRRIPGMAAKVVPSIYNWAYRKWRAYLGVKRKEYPQWFFWRNGL